jgi:hypothetical protein
MKPGKLSELLEKIRDAIPDIDEVDDRGREILDGLREDVNGLLDRDEAHADEPLQHRMKHAVEYFQATHPVLTALISEASTVLSNAGI